VQTDEGWLYLAVLLDLFSRRIVGWAMDKRMTRALTLRALHMAAQRRRPPKGLIHHTDQGSQYASGDYQRALGSRGVVCSMSRAGDCFDNSVAESFFATIKKECISRIHFATHTEAYDAIASYIDGFYNPVRRHSTLQNVSPIDYERAIATVRQAA